MLLGNMVLCRLRVAEISGNYYLQEVFRKTPHSPRDIRRIYTKRRFQPDLMLFSVLHLKPPEGILRAGEYMRLRAL